MKPQMRDYRKKFRAEIIPKSYNAKIHLMFLLLVVPLLTLMALVQIEEFTIIGILCFFLAIVYCNLHVYIVHRFFLHQKMPLMKWAHEMHMIHHLLYDEDNMEYEELNDIYMLLMPPKILALYYLIYCPLILVIIYQFVSLNNFFYIAAAFMLWFGYYEIIHFIEHLPDKHPIMKFSYARFLKRFHKGHHHQQYMHKANFDIAIPSFDFVFGSNFENIAKRDN